MLQNQEFIQEFVEEATTHIETVESGLLKITSSDSQEIINDIFRAVHSIKGTAGFFGLKKIVDVSHSMENVLGSLRNGDLEITSDMVDLLLLSNDCLKTMIQDIHNSENTDINEFVNKLSEIQKNNGKILESSPPDNELVFSDKNLNKVTLSGTEKDIVKNSLKFGHKLYMVRLKLTEHLGNTSPVSFFKKLDTIGHIVDSQTDISNIHNLDECLDGDISFTFLFTTVLEKSLLPLAIEVPENTIEELDANIKEEEYHKLFDDTSSDHSFSSDTDRKLHETSQKEFLGKKAIAPPIDDSIRVHVSLLNSLLNLASEMVLGRNQLLRALEKHKKNIPGIDAILQNIDRITTELQENIMHTRMQPVGNIFNKFPRIIRDLSKKLGKEIDLELEGVDVELDKSIIEALTDPLTHLVRNAADHGLESPSARMSAGKPTVGKILMKAFHESGYVNIDICDDGVGIDLDKIKKKALEKDLLSKSDLSILTDQEALQLLFKPGFSTADKITDVSGRGVGMDVVKTNIEKLGGTIEIFTEPGKGSTFRLLLPLTLAIIPSLIVEVENQKFALPQVNLQEIVRIKPEDSSRKIEHIHNSQVLRLRGKLLPIVHLSDVLGLSKTYIDPATGERKTDKRKTLYDQRNVLYLDAPSSQASVETDSNRRKSSVNTLRILVLKIGSRKFGIAVDTIHGSEEILVKPLPKYIKDSKCYSGVTILGDGKISMILDAEGIIMKSNLKFIEEKSDHSDLEMHEAEERMKEQQNLLLFKCSGSETFALDLSLVSRVEEIHPEDIEKVGAKEYITFRQNSLRVIRPEHFLSVTELSGIKDKLYVIIPKLVSHPIGIIIEEILDTMQTSVALNEEDIKLKGLMGSTILNDKLVLLINIYELFELADPEHYNPETEKAADRKATVLIAEDTPFFQRMEKSYLEMAGYNVLTAQNGKEALQILQEHKVDVVVSDIHMPVMDGLELIKKIREDKNLSCLPAIAVTSMTGSMQKQAGLNAGFDFYEFKLDKSNLLEKVEMAIQKRRSTYDRKSSDILS
ncbi:MAG: chemotaxis protein CheW [Clostridia bacterium]|nr:chemotaxis protein CheW [Clostridia bacterium]